MAELYVTRIRTTEGDKQIDYNALANLPTIPSDVVKYTQQTLTDDQKAQARENIGVTGLKHADQHKIGGSDPIAPSDIGAASIPAMRQVNLTFEGWELVGEGTEDVYYQQVAPVPGVKADETLQLISISPVPSTQSAYSDAGIIATKQGVDSLTFTAAALPTVTDNAPIVVYVVIQDIDMTNKDGEQEGEVDSE